MLFIRQGNYSQYFLYNLKKNFVHENKHNILPNIEIKNNMNF